MTASTYRIWEPPTRSELPRNDARVISFSRGELSAPIITVDEEVLEHRIKYHSLDGMEFGYMGAGPSDLALNILALVVPEKEAFRLHIPFKFALLKSVGFHGGELTMQAVIEWLRGQYAKELSDPVAIAQEKTMREAWALGSAEAREDAGYDALEAPDVVDPNPPEPELVHSCDSAFCKECRLGESDAEVFFENVRRLLRRSKSWEAWSDLEMMIVDRHFEAGNSPQSAAKEIAIAAAGMLHPAAPEVSQNRPRD